MSKFKVGDWVVRKPEARSSWWRKKCQLSYCIDPDGPIQVRKIYGSFSLHFGRDVGSWCDENFTLAHDPNIPVNLDDYL